MRGVVPPDPETAVSQTHFAVIHSPHRRRRRFPAGLVTLAADPQEALRLAHSDTQRHAAEVLGPSKSSEGQFLYYLVRWLEAD